MRPSGATPGRRRRATPAPAAADAIGPRGGTYAAVDEHLAAPARPPAGRWPCTPISSPGGGVGDPRAMVGARAHDPAQHRMPGRRQRWSPRPGCRPSRFWSRSPGPSEDWAADPSRRCVHKGHQASVPRVDALPAHEPGAGGRSGAGWARHRQAAGVPGWGCCCSRRHDRRTRPGVRARASPTTVDKQTASPRARRRPRTHRRHPATRRGGRGRPGRRGGLRAGRGQARGGVFRELDRLAGEGAVLATNTSAIRSPRSRPRPSRPSKSWALTSSPRYR